MFLLGIGGCEVMRLWINSKFYKEEGFSNITSSDTRSIFPGDLRVARCFSFNMYWRLV